MPAEHDGYELVPYGVVDPDAWVSLADRAKASGWSPIPLAEIASGQTPRPSPTVGVGPRGGGLLYPGRRHSIVAESEAGKTWLALLQARAELAAGSQVVFIDFEDDVHGFTARLLDMDVPMASLPRLHYLRPDAPLTPGLWPFIEHVLGSVTPTLVILDGVTDGMALHGLDPLSNRDVAEFSRRLLRPLTTTGAALVVLDHVVKASEGRGRYALGGQHKLADINGAQLVLEPRKPFGRGTTGRSGLFVAKDRPGCLRAGGLPSHNGLTWLGDLVCESLGAGGALSVDLVAPVAGPPEPFRPTAVMDKVRQALAGAPEPLTQRGILDRVGGRADVVRQAISALIDDGNVVADRGPRGALLHRLAGPQ